MSKRAEEAALKAYPVLFSERNGLDNTFKDRRSAFEKGYEQAEKELIPLINRLCEAILFESRNKVELVLKIQAQIEEKEEEL